MPLNLFQSLKSTINLCTIKSLEKHKHAKMCVRVRVRVVRACVRAHVCVCRCV